MDTVSDAIRRLQADGYTGNWFATADHQLSCTVTGDVIDPSTVEIDHILRFEGQSDPDDMTILYALRSPTGAKGLYSAPPLRPAIAPSLSRSAFSLMKPLASTWS